MSSMQILQVIPRHLQNIRKNCGWWGNSKLLELVSKAEKLVGEYTSKPKTTNLSELSIPFVFAVETDFMKFRIITLDYFSDLFSLSTYTYFPSNKLTDKALSICLHDIDSFTSEDRMKTCRTITSILHSPSSAFFIHGNALLKIFTFLLSLYHKSQGSAASEVVKMTIEDSLRHILGYYGKQSVIPKYGKVKSTMNFIVNSVVRNAITISEVLPKMHSKFPVTIFDADAVCIVRAFAGILANEVTKSNQNFQQLQGKGGADQQLNDSTPTLELCCSILNELLSQEKKTLFSDSILELILNREVHIAMMALALDYHIELAIPFSNLLITIWKKYSKLYIERLYELFDKGILHSLSSPNSIQIERTCRILNHLTSEPQLFVDLFVNFDCDNNGRYVSLFESTVSLVSKHSYPDDHCQLSSLVVLLDILKCMWHFLNTSKTSEVPVTDTLIEAKRQKDVFQQGLDLFKKDPKKGLKYFITKEITTESKCAEFLFNTQQLDPAGVGEIIALQKNRQILKDYVHFFDFKGKSFEEAFRSFLSKFRIPGEGQMIDRVMEEFGAKYFNDNPGTFSTADTVYVVAYSALMLYTDAHHPNLNSRMSLDEFIANNRGIDGGKDLPREFLVNLYNDITTKEITLLSKEDVPSLLTRSQKAQLYAQRCNSILQEAKNSITMSSSQPESIFKRIDSSDIVSPMFQVVWAQVLAVFAIAFDSTDDEKVVNCSLKGLSYASHIASHCYCEEALEMLVSSFTKFTKLRTYGAEEIKAKNIKCTQELLSVAINDRNVLRGTWSLLMDEVSALEKLKYFTIPDILFTGSDSLDRESINDLVKAMCQTSANELSEQPPRMYMLLRLADVAYFNMGRPKIIWKEIWETISNQIIDAGSMEDVNIAKATINVLWQITRKFIEQPETNAFHFQEHFLRPFFEIFIVQQSAEVKGLIVECTSSLVNDLANSLHSGWSVVFQIMNACAVDYRSKGYELMTKVVNEHLQDLSSSQIVHLQSVLISFVLKGKTPKIGAKAVLLFEKIASFLSHINADNEVWGCFFASLQKCIMSPTPIIKKRAVLSTVEIMQKEKVSDSVKETIINEFVPSVFNLFVEPEMTNLLTEIMDIPLKIELKLDILMKCCLHENPDFSLNSLTLLSVFLSNNSDEISSSNLRTVVVDDIKKLCKLKRVELVIFFSKALKTFENDKKMKKSIISVIKSSTDVDDIGHFECSMMQLYIDLLLQDGKKQAAAKIAADFIKKIEGKNEDIHNYIQQLKEITQI